MIYQKTTANTAISSTKVMFVRMRLTHGRVGWYAMVIAIQERMKRTVINREKHFARY